MTRLIFRHREREEKQKQVDFSETKILKLLNCKLIDMQMLGALQTRQKVVLFLMNNV